VLFLVCRYCFTAINVKLCLARILAARLTPTPPFPRSTRNEGVGGSPPFTTNPLHFDWTEQTSVSIGLADRQPTDPAPRQPTISPRQSTPRFDNYFFTSTTSSDGHSAPFDHRFHSTGTRPGVASTNRFRPPSFRPISLRFGSAAAGRLAPTPLCFNWRFGRGESDGPRRRRTTAGAFDRPATTDRDRYRDLPPPFAHLDRSLRMRCLSLDLIYALRLPFGSSG